MGSRAAVEFRYEKLTWPEINDAVELGKVCILPCSAVEQHGPHLPLDVDVICPTEIARGAGRLIPEKMLLLPTHCYGYTGHVMDFPGTINTHFEHFIDGMLDITKSLAYHGFKKIILLNGHGSNWPNLDLVARRTNLETDAECVPICWWGLLTVDKEFMPRWRQSKFPGGCAHACELETSLYLYLDGDNVRKDQIKNGTISFNEEDSPFMWVDLFGAGPATLISWTSSYSETGVLGRSRAGDRREGTGGLRRIRQAVGSIRELVQGPSQGPPSRPPPNPPDDADALGAKADRVVSETHLTQGAHSPIIRWNRRLRARPCDSLGYCSTSGRELRRYGPDPQTKWSRTPCALKNGPVSQTMWPVLASYAKIAALTTASCWLV